MSSAGITQEIIDKADRWAREEIAKTGFPAIGGYDLSNRKGQELAHTLGVDRDIVALGTRLMDVKLGEALRAGKLPLHVAMNAHSSKVFLEPFDLPHDVQDKVINCIEGHHKGTPWDCKEAEVCANADCYRFLRVAGFLSSVVTFTHENQGDLMKGIEHAEKKADEKWAILSLSICKKELEPEYALIKEIVSHARAKG